MTDTQIEPEGAAPTPQRAARYSRGAIALHWAIAACFAFQIGLGWRMDGPRGPETFAVFQLHKSVGITILLLTLIRLGWRIANPPPPFPPTMKAWEKRLAHAVHVGFYVLLLGLPLTGWLLVSASKTAIPTLLFGAIPWPHVPGVPGLAPGAKAGVEEAAEIGHHALIYISYAVLLLHVAGALKHQFLERGGDMARMIPVPPRALGAAALAAIAGIVGLTAIATLIRLTPLAAPTPVATGVPVAEATPAALPLPAAAPSATPTPEASPTPEATATPVAPSRWTVRRAASSLSFNTSWSEGPVDGRFGSWDAAILFDPAALDASSVKVTIDMTSAKTGVADTEGALPDPDWFAAATHPVATFAATTFRHRSGDRYEAIGTLSLRGVSRPLTLPFTLKIDGDVATMRGSTTIDRTIFGVGQGEWKATTDLKAGVAVTVAIKADRKPDR
ncbi:MAG: YceI family protein [Sphingomonas sp.]|jgi:cytochrome b561/polyisoprenoid-binding protein YceI|uniref:YceI family protein n=1 Tax=Sphingomonas sp. TaxID=28214 RepID=UPI0035694D57